MPSKQCYHCREWIADRKTHDCWTTTEEKLTEDLSEPLQEAWERLREAATAFGDQRVYASHKSIMFSRKNCYFFVRPKKSALELCFFLGRKIDHPFVRKAEKVSQVKVGHIAHVVHRDEVESPLTDWLKEAYDVSETLRAAPKPKAPLKGRADRNARAKSTKKKAKTRKSKKK